MENKSVTPAAQVLAPAVSEIRSLLEDSRKNVAQQVNQELLSTYWKIGEIIVRYEQNDSVHAAYGCQPPPYVLESGPAPPPTPSHEDGSDGGAFLSSLLTLPAAAGAGRLLYLIQRLFLFVCRNRVRQMKFTVQAQHLQYRQFLFTFLFHIRTSLSIATVRLPTLGSRSLRAAICLRQLCRIFHLLGNRTGPVGIIRRRTQLIVGCLFFR